MPSDIRPNLGLESNWASAASGWDVGVNKNLNILDAIIFCNATFGLTAPPGSPAMGSVYLVGASATGAWAGKDNQIAIYAVSSWIFLVPKAGWRIRNSSTGAYWAHNGTAWAAETVTVAVDLADLGDVDLAGLADGKILVWNATAAKWKLVSLLMEDAPADGLPYERVAGGWSVAPVRTSHFAAGLLSASQVVGMFSPSEKMQFPVAFAGSVAVAEVAPTSTSVVFDIKKNGTTVGTITFAVGSRKGTFAAVATTTLDPAVTVPDQLKIVAPATPNAAFAGVSITLKGVRVA